MDGDIRSMSGQLVDGISARTSLTGVDETYPPPLCVSDEQRALGGNICRRQSHMAVSKDHGCRLVSTGCDRLERRTWLSGD